MVSASPARDRALVMMSLLLDEARSLLIHDGLTIG